MSAQARGVCEGIHILRHFLSRETIQLIQDIRAAQSKAVIPGWTAHYLRRRVANRASPVGTGPTEGDAIDDLFLQAREGGSQRSPVLTGSRIESQLLWSYAPNHPI
jgi:hypothetical protein